MWLKKMTRAHRTVMMGIQLQEMAEVISEKQNWDTAESMAALLKKMSDMISVETGWSGEILVTIFLFLSFIH